MNRKLSVIATYILVTILVGASVLLAACAPAATATPTATALSQLVTQSTTDVPSPQATQTATVAPTQPSQQPTSSVSLTLSLAGYGNAGAKADTVLSLADMLLYAVQDEQVARGEYAVIMEAFGSQNPYANIMRAEESHLASLATLYGTYGLTMPSDESASHVVKPASLLAAARTGVQAEIDNIAMYDRFLSQSLPEDVRTVFNSLRAASENHLASFQNQVAKLG